MTDAADRDATDALAAYRHRYAPMAGVVTHYDGQRDATVILGTRPR